MQSPNSHYVYIWEFEVIPDNLTKFLEFYGPSGVWSQLFAKASGYIGTLLLNDQSRETRYLTVDRWVNDQAYESFLAQFRADYEKLDRACESFTSHEASLGSYWVFLDQPGSNPSVEATSCGKSQAAPYLER